MGKIIGRGVLLLKSDGKDLKFGYQLSSEGILLSPFEENPALQTLKQALPKPAVSGPGHLILNALPASPNDAFYDVTFSAKSIGTGSESFSLQVKESRAFAHGPQSHFSNLDLTFKYSKKKGLSIAPRGKVTVHLYEGVFENGETIQLKPEWNKESETLIFTSATPIQMDSIGKLSDIVVEAGSGYDRWAQVQGLYTFDEPIGTGSGFETHDISGQSAPVLYFEGKKAAVPTGQEAAWTTQGIEFKGGFLASQDGVPNPVVGSILETEAFSVELWIKPTKAGPKNPSWIFAFQNRRDEPEKKNPYNFFLGQEADAPGAHVNAKFDFPELGVPDLNGQRWETPLKSPANSVNSELMHVVYSCGRDGMQRIFINGAQVAQRSDPGYDNKWEGGLRLLVGSNLPRIMGEIKPGEPNFIPGSPWNGEMHQLAIFNRALTAEEVYLHYSPAIKITGNFSLDHVIHPLDTAVFPFNLTIDELASALIVDTAVDLNIKPQLGFRQVYLECNKLQDSPSWAFAGRFQTRFWEDLFDLDAHESGPANLQLTSPVGQPGTINIPGIGIAKYQDILLETGDQQVWELSFGNHQEYGLIAMVLENEIADYGDFLMGRPHLVLTEPIVLTGTWLGEEMEFISEGADDGRVLKGDTTFPLLFTIELPPEADPETGDSLGDPILFDNEEMTISIDVELRKEGFLGVLNVSFEYEGEPMSLPERRIYVAPASKMALLGDILEVLKAQASTLFAEHRKHQEDYYLSIGASQPNISFGASATAEENLTSLLPLLFDTPTEIESDNAIFNLNETFTECTLTLNIEKLKRENTTQDELKADYDNFIGKFTLGAGSLSLLKRRIAERLPLDFDQLFYYYYGWNTAGNYLDLHAGMRLRVDLQNYQFVQASDPTAQRGFAGSGSFYIPVNSYTHNDAGNSQLLGFGPFLSRLQTESSIDIANEGAGGVMDLLNAGNRKAFYRIFFPKNPSTSLGPERVVTIIGANTAQEMEAATTGFDADANLAPSAGVSFFFRGKAMIIPEIQVYVQNSAVFVPLGTTLRQLLEARDDVPLALSGQDLSGFAGKNRPRRLIHDGADSTTSYRFINLKSDEVVGNRDALGLPLIKGDRINY